ncbi:hypothetical protein LJY25_03610 [Hymenobacter sp. BT175]|uniref:hypothetical protein n=1 Tax=Hymenobacter translucens TaxID=2886507 RepID=UPI001D0DDF3F|nr:hypothetical protein [Hymenobacter translucens]MCC2545518.1 hypothetical protein [Hymenobacter translucens]
MQFLLAQPITHLFTYSIRMTALTVDQFLHLLRTHAGTDATAWISPLLGRLRTAFEALAPYAPASIHAVTPPWQDTALAFEARWADGRTLTVATQLLLTSNLDSQVTLRQHNRTLTSVLTAHTRLDQAMRTCLGPASQE